ncbi:hypothetical protein J6590_087732 [Homalodisca vitripennis]|nr:hypothetical protein J6590_087732 [Homalodisca vitripennis]
MVRGMDIGLGHVLPNFGNKYELNHLTGCWKVSNNETEFMIAVTQCNTHFGSRLRAAEPRVTNARKIAVPLRPQRLHIYHGEDNPDLVYQQVSGVPASQNAGCAPDVRGNGLVPCVKDIQEFLPSLCRMFL